MKMDLIESSLYHRVLPPEKPASDKHPTIIYLHGRGADEEDLLGLSGALDERLLSISVRAPFRFDNNGGYTWYEILEMGKPEPEMFSQSYEKLARFIDDAINFYSIDPKKLYVLGFSMGTVMAYALLLTKPHLFAGVIANSGYLPEETHLDYLWNDVAGKELFISHGVLDPVIPVMASQRARFLFEQANAVVTYREYDMAHQINDAGLADINAWLRERLQS